MNFTLADSDNYEGKFGYEDAVDVRYGYQNGTYDGSAARRHGKCSFFLIRPYSDLSERSFFIVDDRNSLLIWKKKA